MYLAFAIGSWFLVRRGRCYSAALLAAGAAIVRINGLFLAVGLAVLFVHRTRQSAFGYKTAPRMTGGLLILAPLLSVGGYFWWLQTQSGRWDEWFRTERLGWGRTISAPWSALRQSVIRIAHATSADLGFQSVMEILFAGLLLLCVLALIRKGRGAEAVYVGLTLASLTTSSYYLSIPRSTITCFPVFILAGEWIASRRERHGPWLVVGLVFASLSVLAVNSFSVVNDYWAG